jgi:mono/diheme cytochrome c family protein
MLLLQRGRAAGRDPAQIPPSAGVWRSSVGLGQFYLVRWSLVLWRRGGWWLLALTMTCQGQGQEPAMVEWGQRYEKEILPLIRSHCLDCHSGDGPSGEFDFSGLLAGPAAIARPMVWEQVGQRIRLNEMPPAGSSQFSDSEKARIHAWLDSRPGDDRCQQLATDETQAWYQGYVMSRRLTRTEYLNAMRDLLGVAVDPQFEIPSDGAGGLGFDTHGSTLFTSPIHIEQYLAAAADTVGRVLASPESRQDLIGLWNPVEDAREQSARVIAGFARLAWRRPLLDSERQRLLQLYDFAVTASSAADPLGSPSQATLKGLEHALTGVLVSPHFLFVVETESPAGGVQPLTPAELATRLALFLWSSIPDAALLAAAEQGNLTTEAEILAQTQRLLADPRSRALGENFGLQWLGLANFLETAQPDAASFPEYNRELAGDLREEIVRTISGVFADNRSVLALIDSPVMHVNGRVAKYYGLSLSDDAPWQEVAVGDLPRGGVLTSGAILIHTSYPRRTSPVLRGRWLLEEILGSRVPPPPPGVPALEESTADHVASLRERLERHRQNPECAACHDRMDPLGFGLENFDALGRWRQTDQGLPIDAQGTLPTGQTFTGPAELKQVLLQRQEEFQQHLARKLLGFALGRALNKFDDCVIEAALAASRSDEHRAQAMIRTIVVSYPFRHRYFKAAETQP